jgi:hypothetical protein
VETGRIAHFAVQIDTRKNHDILIYTQWVTLIQSANVGTLLSSDNSLSFRPFRALRERVRVRGKSISV